MKYLEGLSDEERERYGLCDQLEWHIIMGLSVFSRWDDTISELTPLIQTVQERIHS